MIRENRSFVHEFGVFIGKVCGMQVHYTAATIAMYNELASANFVHKNSLTEFYQALRMCYSL